MQPIRAEEIKDLDPDNTIILDVREPIEVELGQIDRSINISVNELRQQAVQLDKNKEIIVYCAVGLRGHVATSMLNQMGFTTKNLLGGYNFYKMFYK